MQSKSVNKFTRGDGLLESFLAKKRAERANKLIPTGARKGKILDIGCGSYPYFLLSTEFSQKYGIDPSLSGTYSDSKIHLKKTKLSGEKLAFGSNFFDVVTMLAVFEHIDYEYLTNVLSEINRILKKDGILIITTPAPWSDKILHITARTGLISSEEIHEHKHNHPNSKIISLLVKAGFKKQKISSGFFELGLNMWFSAVK